MHSNESERPKYDAFRVAISEATYLSKAEKEEYLQGASILFDLGWPANFDALMARRAIAGVVPRYEGFHSFLEYQYKWAQENMAASLEREKNRK